MSILGAKSLQKDTINFTKNYKNQKSKNELQEFLNKFRNEKGSKKYNITSMGKPAGSYYIPEESYEEFLNIYSKSIKNGLQCHLTEKPSEISSILVDFDLKFEFDQVSRKYTVGDIHKIVSFSFSYLKKYIKLNEENAKCYVFEREEPYTKNGYTKDGIHMIFPFIHANADFKHLFRNYLISKLGNTFEEMENLNSIENTIDSTVIDRNNWMLYGSNKINLKPYKLTYIINKEGDEEDLITNIDEIIKICSVAFNNKYEIKFRKSNKEQYEQELEKYKSINKSIKDKKNPINNSTKSISGNKTNYKSKTENQEDIEFAKKLASILSYTRAEDYKSWIEVGWCLHNIDNSLMDSWIDFSKKSTKYNDGECENLWSGMKKRNLGMGSLCRWARIDNPSKFEEYRRINLRNYIEKSSSCTSYHVAKVLYQMYRYQFICGSLKYKTWYEYRNHRWHQVEEGIFLRKKISNELVNEYIKVSNDYNNKALESDNNEKELYLKKKNKFDEIGLKLCSTKFKRDVMSEALELFYDPYFTDKLDSNRSLIGFENGVFDLNNYEFRDGRPEDHLSLSTKIDYVDYDDDLEEIQNVFTIMEQIHPDPEMREYVLSLLASCLSGHILDQKFHIWTGTGCHTKGTKIMMYDNSYKLVEDIEVNDRVMGNDNTERIVKKLHRGKDNIYEIKDKNGKEESYMVNGDHLLSLIAKDVSMENNIKWLKNKNRWRVYWHEKNIVGYPEEKRKYFAINEGDKTHYYKKDTKYFENKEEAKKALDIFVRQNNHKNVINDNDIINVNVRDYIQISKKLSKYYGFKIKDDGMKTYKIEIKDTNNIDNYYGFELDGNNLYKLSNGIVTHNSNGKSIIIKLFELALGKYCAKLPISLLTSKRAASNSATPELARTKGRRFAVLQEPEEEVQINVGLMKELSGGDTIQARELFAPPVEFEPQFKMILTCNHLPKISTNDGGTWRRIRVVEFKSRFEENPDPENPNEYKKDKELPQKLIDYKEAFMSILIKYYRIYKINGLKEPEEVLAYTKSYQHKSDYYMEFITDVVEITESEKDNLKIDELYLMFKSWYKETQGENKCPGRKDLKGYMEKKYGSYKKGWTGMKIRIDDDEEPEII